MPAKPRTDAAPSRGEWWEPDPGDPADAALTAWLERYRFGELEAGEAPPGGFMPCPDCGRVDQVCPTCAADIARGYCISQRELL